MNEECCNHNCNQGRDCPLRQRSLAEEITEGFKALEAMRNNKPVAWMLVDENWNDFCRYSSYPTKGAIPLYTNPAKTLTDEEIKEVIDDPQFECVFDLEDFARAILRKAQEK
jgi:hypothetical protein